MKVMILAAGRGSRLNELTYKTPKPLVKINNKPLLAYHLEKLEKAGFSEVVINISWLAEQVENYIKSDYAGKLQITLYHEQQALETGGGVLAALQDLSESDEAFLVINSDVMTDFDFSKIPDKIEAAAHLYLVENPIHHPSGDFCLGDNTVLSLKTEKHNTEEALTFSGISILTPALFTGCMVEKFSLGDLFRKYVPQGLITGEQLDSKWFDVGTIQRLKLAQDWQKAQPA